MADPSYKPVLLDKFAVIYKDDCDWWCDDTGRDFINYGSLFNLPSDYAQKVTLLQHCDIHKALKGIGRRVATNRYWVEKAIAPKAILSYTIQWKQKQTKSK